MQDKLAILHFGIILHHLQTQLYKIHRLVDSLTNLTKSISTESCGLLIDFQMLSARKSQYHNLTQDGTT